MAKTILLTGAAGFIGFHLARRLSARGDVVVGLDNFNDYYSPELKRDRAQILRSEGVEVIEGDICNSFPVEGSAFSHIVHLAAQAGVRYSLQNPQAYVRSNVSGFVEMLELARRLEIPFIYASSSSVYGRNEKIPFSEEDRTDLPASLYGATKKADELIASAYHDLYGIPVTGLRFFTVYGPWGRPDMAYSLFTEAILEGRPIKVFNQGKLSRDFTYIDDIIDGTVASIDRSSPCEIFNLGNSHAVNLERFIDILEESLGKKAIREYVEMQAGDVKQTFADLTKSERVLGYKPRIGLEEGIPRFVDWYRQRICV